MKEGKEIIWVKMKENEKKKKAIRIFPFDAEEHNDKDYAHNSNYCSEYCPEDHRRQSERIENSRTTIVLLWFGLVWFGLMAHQP